MSLETKQKIINLLTVCIKAGMAVKGFDPVCEALRGGRAFCVLAAADASAKTLKEADFMCRKFNVSLVHTELSKEELGLYAGKQTAVIAVCDKGFARKFLKLSGINT